MLKLKNFGFILFVLLSAFSCFAQVKLLKVNGLMIACEKLGVPKKGTVLLIGGTGYQLTDWPDEFCSGLVKKGYQVIRYDNRDVGLSTKFDNYGEPHWLQIFDALATGKQAELPYTIDDMANDAFDLLLVLNIPKAHIVGISGGAIIAQTFAAKYPQQTLSLTSMMGTTGNPAVTKMKPAIQAIVLSAPKPGEKDTSVILAHQVKVAQAIGSPKYPRPDDELKAHFLASMRRSYNAPALNRHAAVALAAGDRRTLIKTIHVPALVIHGESDPLVPVEAGKEVASLIFDAKLKIIPGMGHDLPDILLPQFVNMIDNLAGKAN